SKASGEAVSPSPPALEPDRMSAPTLSNGSLPRTVRGSSGSLTSPTSGSSPDSATSHSSPMSSVGELSAGRSHPHSTHSLYLCSHWSTHFFPLVQAGMIADWFTTPTGAVRVDSIGG